MTNLETLKQQTADLEAKLEEMKAEIDRLGNWWEMKCPYKVGDKVYFLDSEGHVCGYNWSCKAWELNVFNHSGIFPTKRAAELESKRRNLLTRFRAFRDECNGNWKADWNDHNSKKWVIVNSEEGMYAMWTVGLNSFLYFGYFKNQFDAERAIELFGDEIKTLFVDCEV